MTHLSGWTRRTPVPSLTLHNGVKIQFITQSIPDKKQIFSVRQITDRRSCCPWISLITSRARLPLNKIILCYFVCVYCVKSHTTLSLRTHIAKGCYYYKSMLSRVPIFSLLSLWEKQEYSKKSKGHLNACTHVSHKPTNKQEKPKGLPAPFRFNCVIIQISYPLSVVKTMQGIAAQYLPESGSFWKVNPPKLERVASLLYTFTWNEAFFFLSRIMKMKMDRVDDG